MKSADAVAALSARVSAVTSGEPGVVGVGAVPAPLRAIAYASSRPAFAASARLNAANEPGVVLGAATVLTELKPAGSFTGNGIDPAVCNCLFAESSSATIWIQTSLLQYTGPTPPPLAA